MVLRRRWMRSRMAMAGMLAWLLCAGCAMPIRPLYPPAPNQPAQILYVYNNHWHTGFVLRYADLPARQQHLFAEFKDDPWIEIGWGDDAYYPAPQGTSGLKLHAAFASTGSVVHVAGVDPNPVAHYRLYYVEIYRIHLTPAGYARLLDFISAAIPTDGQGRPLPAGPGLYGHSRFYRARGHYSFLHTCNNWTADGLRAAGFPISPLYAQTAQNFSFQMKMRGPEYEPDVIAVED